MLRIITAIVFLALPAVVYSAGASSVKDKAGAIMYSRTEAVIESQPPPVPPKPESEQKAPPAQEKKELKPNQLKTSSDAAEEEATPPAPTLRDAARTPEGNLPQPKRHKLMVKVMDGQEFADSEANVDMKEFDDGRSGLLVVFAKSARFTIPLANIEPDADIIFIGKNGDVREMAVKASRDDSDVYTAKVFAKGLLLLKSGVASAMGIKIGDTIHHKALQPAPEAKIQEEDPKQGSEKAKEPATQGSIIFDTRRSKKP